MSAKSHAPATLLRKMIWRFFFSRAFHAAGGEVLDKGSGDNEGWLRGEQRSADVDAESRAGGGETGAMRVGTCAIDGRVEDSTGEERQDRSIESTSGDADFVAMGCEEIRSRVSIAGDLGEERHDKSTESTSGDAVLAVVGCGDVRSKVSMLGDADFVFCNRGDVRRLDVVSVRAFDLIDLVGIDATELADSDEELDDIDVSGGRVVDLAVVVRRAS
jgi:hypothetical protein